MLRLSDKQLQLTIDKTKGMGLMSHQHEHNKNVFLALIELQERRAAEQPAEKKPDIIILDESGPMPKESDLEKLTGQKWGRE